MRLTYKIFHFPNRPHIRLASPADSVCYDDGCRATCGKLQFSHEAHYTGCALSLDPLHRVQLSLQYHHVIRADHHSRYTVPGKVS